MMPLFMRGPKKLIFLIRDKDDATRAAASVESCRFVVCGSLVSMAAIAQRFAVGAVGARAARQQWAARPARLRQPLTERARTRSRGEVQVRGRVL